MAHESSNDLNTPMIMVIGLISAVATFVIILGLIGLYHTVRVRQETASTGVEYADPDTVLNSQAAALREAAWIDPGQGQVRLPIDVAMQKVVDAYAGDRDNDIVRNSPFASSKAVVKDDPNEQIADAQSESEAIDPGDDPKETLTTVPDDDGIDDKEAQAEDLDNDQSDDARGQATQGKRTNEPLEKAAALGDDD